MQAKPVKPEQYILDLPHRPAMGRDDFLVTPANEAGVVAIERWPHWHYPVMILSGPAGSGKSHLAAVWLSMSGARQIEATDLNEEDVPDRLSAGALLIENVGAGNIDERALFHAINLARELKATILMTSRTRPSEWQVDLPDLASRLKAAELATLDPPDDTLLRGVLVKQFSDRQIAVDERTVSFMMSRMERSFEGLRSLVAEIDRRAMAERADVTRPFVARVLADWTSATDDR